MRSLVAAFDLCRRHKADPKIFVTADPRGVEALASDEVKAVVLKRALPKAVIPIMEAITPAQIAKLHQTCGQLKIKGRFDPAAAANILACREIFNTASDAQTIGRDIEDLAQALKTVTGKFKIMYAWFHGQLQITPRYHVDTIDVVRGSTVYKGRGVRMITADLSDEDYAAVCVHEIKLSSEEIEARYAHETLEAGDVLFTKSRRDGGTFGGTQSLVHRTVDTAEEGQVRIFCGMDLYKPEFQ